MDNVESTCGCVLTHDSIKFSDSGVFFSVMFLGGMNIVLYSCVKCYARHVIRGVNVLFMCLKFNF